MNACVRDIADLPERENLEPAAVREDGFLPPDELMHASRFFDNFFSRLQMQVIGITEQHVGTERDQFFMRDALHSSSRSYGHEERRGDIAVSSFQSAASA